MSAEPGPVQGQTLPVWTADSTEVTGKCSMRRKGSLLSPKLSLAPCPGDTWEPVTDRQSKFRMMLGVKASQMVSLPINVAPEHMVPRGDQNPSLGGNLDGTRTGSKESGLSLCIWRFRKQHKVTNENG